MNYYNEHDPFAAAWLRELIKAGHIAPGEVDERSIEDVKPDELRKFTQCHFFAGIGVWSYALRQAGWPDDRPVWTGSCPCQPFSTAGQRKGTADERHLWPALYHLISHCRPVTFFGEQVASKDGLTWFDTVQSDLEEKNYAVGKADLCAAGFGAPHIRQRLYFVADASQSDQHKWTSGGQQPLRQPSESGVRVANNNSPRLGSRWTSETSDGGDSSRIEPSGLCDAGGRMVNPESEQVGLSRCSRESRGADSSTMGDSEQRGRYDRRGLYRGCAEESSRVETSERGVVRNEAEGASLTNGFWREADWIACRDGKYRPVEPGTFPLAHGATNRVGRLRGYGNALVAPVAQGFIEAFLETESNL